MSDAEKLLREFDSSTTVKFHLIQILLIQGKVEEAIALVKTLDEFKANRPGVISLLVQLMKMSKKNSKDITALFTSAIEHFAKTPSAKELEIYIKENANYQIECGNLEKACEMLERMRIMKPSDFKILSKLINLYSKFNIGKAQKLSKELPSLEDIVANSDIDIDTLDNQFSLLSSKYSKLKTTTTMGIKSPVAKKAAAETTQKSLKPKKKRKIILPKMINPHIAIDPERWVPLRERSYYKGKRNKKKGLNLKGTQGAVSSKEPQSPKVATPDNASEKFKSKAEAMGNKSHGRNVKKKKGSKW